MLLNLFAQGYPFNITIGLLVLHLFCIVMALSVHELAHGYAAYKMGDDTARLAGRLTLNPLAHIDPVGFLMMVLVGYGWAKPVPINTLRFREQRKGLAIVSFAGPLSNLVLAFVSALFCCLLSALGYAPVLYAEFAPLNVLAYTLYLFALLNIGLALFNLIPLPPLDGSNILLSFLKPHAAQKYMQIRFYTRYIFLGLMALSFLANRIPIFALIYEMIWWPFNELRYLLIDWIFALGNFIFGWI